MIRILIAFVASLLVALAAQAASLQLKGAPAARAETDAGRQIDILSFQWGVEPSPNVKRTGPGTLTIAVGPAASDGDVDGRDFLIWQRNTSLIPSITLTAQEGGKEGGKYVQYKLERCFVKSWSTSGDADDRPTGGGGVISYAAMTVVR